LLCLTKQATPQLVIGYLSMVKIRAAAVVLTFLDMSSLSC